MRLKAATVCGASSSSQRATKRKPAASISSTAATYSDVGAPAAIQAPSISRSSSVIPVALPSGIARRVDRLRADRVAPGGDLLGGIEARRRRAPS